MDFVVYHWEPRTGQFFFLTHEGTLSTDERRARRFPEPVRPWEASGFQAVGPGMCVSVEDARRIRAERLADRDLALRRGPVRVLRH